VHLTINVSRPCTLLLELSRQRLLVVRDSSTGHIAPRLTESRLRMRSIGNCIDTCEGAEEAGVCFYLEIEAAQQKALDLSGTAAPRPSDLRHHRHCAKGRCPSPQQNTPSSLSIWTVLCAQTQYFKQISTALSSGSSLGKSTGSPL